MKLFLRDIIVEVGSKRLEARPAGSGDEEARPTLRMAFRVEKDLQSKPNKARLAIWNLSQDSRSDFQESGPVPVQIEAGYAGATQLLFSGDLQFAGSERQGPDWVTEFEAGDSANAHRTKRIQQKFAPGTQLKAALRAAIDSLGVGLGTVAQKLAEGDFRGGLQQFQKGLTLSGRTSDAIDKLATAAGFQWSIQDGQVVLLKPGEVLPEQTLSLDFESGLVGSPDLGEGGNIQARALLQPAISPGRQVDLTSELVTGRFRVTKVTHSGDTWGTDWYSDFEAQPL